MPASFELPQEPVNVCVIMSTYVTYCMHACMYVCTHTYNACTCRFVSMFESLPLLQLLAPAKRHVRDLGLLLQV
jgi:hypothetical protein